jgi:formylglycine-generating enzyme required for sulfatase activity
MSVSNLQTDEGPEGLAYQQRPHSDLVDIPGGPFCMGLDHHYSEEAPAHRVTVAPFWMDRTPVTNRQFKEFVKTIGCVTFAEIPPDPKDYPGALPHMLYAGSLVFSPPIRPVDLRNWSEWWTFLEGADWRHPYGPKAGSMVPSLPGAMSSCPAEGIWRIPGRVNFPNRTFAWTASSAPHLSQHFRPTATACTT